MQGSDAECSCDIPVGSGHGGVGAWTRTLRLGVLDGKLENKLTEEVVTAEQMRVCVADQAHSSAAMRAKGPSLLGRHKLGLGDHCDCYQLLRSGRYSKKADCHCMRIDYSVTMINCVHDDFNNEACCHAYREKREQ